MQRKQSFPVANCNVKMAESMSPPAEAAVCEEDSEHRRRRQQLINFAHSQWGFNNWSWSVSKQDLDYVDFTAGKYAVGAVAFVSVTVKSLDVHRENIGYGIGIATLKGNAIYQARRGAVTNALRETLLSFGGSVASDLIELLESPRIEYNGPPIPAAMESPAPHDNQNLPNLPNKPPSNDIKKRKDSPENREPNAINRPHPNIPPTIKNVPVPPPPPPIAKAMPIPANLPVNKVFPANQTRPPPPPPQPARPNPNVSFVLQPFGMMPTMYPPRLPPPHVFPNSYYEYAPWHFYDGHHHPNVNLNFNLPPKNLVVNGRSSVECKNACGRPEGEPLQYAPGQGQGCWIKPTIFYDGFWTEQKVKKWVAEQVEKQFPEDASVKSSSPSNSGQTESNSK